MKRFLPLLLLLCFAPQSHAQSVVNTCKVDSTSGASVVLTCTQAIGSGHALIAGYAQGTGNCPSINSLVDSAGSTFQVIGTNSLSAICEGYGYTCNTGASGGTSVTFTLANSTPNFVRGVAIEVSGLATTNCLNATGQWLWNGGSNISPTVKTTATGSYIVGFVNSSGSGAHTAFSGYTTQIDTATAGLVSGSQAIPGTYTPGASGPTGSQWGGIAWAFNLSSGGGGGGGCTTVGP